MREWMHSSKHNLLFVFIIVYTFGKLMLYVSLLQSMLEPFNYFPCLNNTGNWCNLFLSEFIKFPKHHSYNVQLHIYKNSYSVHCFCSLSSSKFPLFIILNTSSKYDVCRFLVACDPPLSMFLSVRSKLFAERNLIFII